MANKSRPSTMEEVNQLHNEWWDSLTDDQKQKLVEEQEVIEKSILDGKR